MSQEHCPHASILATCLSGSSYRHGDYRAMNSSHTGIAAILQLRQSQAKVVWTVGRTAWVHQADRVWSITAVP